MVGSALKGKSKKTKGGKSTLLPVFASSLQEFFKALYWIGRLALTLILIPLKLFNFFRTKPTIENSQYMNWWTRRTILNAKNNGLVIDGAGKYRLSNDESTMGLILCGSSGCGKTNKFIKNNVFQLQHSQVIFDPSGEIHRDTSGYKSQTHNIQIFAPDDPSISCNYNPILRAKTQSDLNYLTDILLSSAFGSGGNKSASSIFFESGAKPPMNIFLRMLKTQAPCYQHIPGLRHLINSYGEDGSALDGLAAQLDDESFNEWKGFISQESNLVQNFLSTAKSALQCFTDPKLARLTGTTDDLDFSALRNSDKPTCLYIIVPEAKIQYYSLLVSCLYTQLFGYLAESPSQSPVYCLMDEFANSAKIPDFSVLSSTIRKRNVSLSLILQDLDQIKLVYQDSASSIFNGSAKSKIFWSGLSNDTCKLIESKCGKTQIETDKGEKTVPLISASTARTMSGQLFLQSDQPPFIIDGMVPFYDMPKWLAASKIPPYKVKKVEGKEKVQYLNLEALPVEDQD